MPVRCVWISSAVCSALTSQGPCPAGISCGVAVGTCAIEGRAWVDSANNQRVLLRHAVHADSSVHRAAWSGRADKTVTRHLSQAGSCQVTPPYPTAPNGRSAAPSPKADRSQQGHKSQFGTRSDPEPDARPHVHCSGHGCGGRSPGLDAFDWAPVFDSQSHVEHEAAVRHAPNRI
jgi:hypothetical protein